MTDSQPSAAERRRTARTLAPISNSFPFRSLAQVYDQDWGDVLLVAQAVMRTNTVGSVVRYVPDVWEREAIARVSEELGAPEWQDLLSRTVAILTQQGKLDRIAIAVAGGAMRPG